MYSRVLVPLDGSPLAEAIIPFLTEIARPLDMSMILLRVIEPVPTAVVEGARHTFIDVSETRRQDAGTYLASIASSLERRGLRAAQEVRVGRPDLQILECARDLGADLIAMSTHGRSGFGRLLFGSVAEQVLRQAEVPVFMMRQTAGKVSTAGVGAG